MYDIAIEGKSKNEITRYFDTIGMTYIDKEWNYGITIKGSSKTLCGDRSNIIPKENTPTDLGEWIKLIGTIDSWVKQEIVTEIESKEFSRDPELIEQYDKIDAKLKVDASADVIWSVKVSIAWSKKLTDEQKNHLLQYVDTFSS
jgi:hypothetical protein